MVDEVKLKVGELTERAEAGRGIIRVGSETMRELAIREGEIVEVEGSKKTAGIAVRSYPSDVGLKIARMDGIMRRNCDSGVGEYVKIHKADVKEAKHVTLAPAQKGLVIQISPNLIRQNIYKRPVVKGDIIVPSPVVRRRDRDSDFFAEFFGMEFDAFFTPFSEDTRFVVTETDPKGIVVITDATDLEMQPRAPDDMKLEDRAVPTVTYEDVGGMRGVTEKVREMIELPLRHPELFERLGVEPPKGVLLYGPPGTGKTLLAKAVANESGAYFINISGPEVMCVSGDTKILTNPDGHVEAESVFGKAGEVERRGTLEIKKLGTPVKTFAMQDGEIKPAMITHVAKLRAKSFKVKLKDGNEVVVSKNQPFLTYENGALVWKRAGELKRGDYVARLNKVNTEERPERIDIRRIRDLVGRAGKHCIASCNIERSNFISLPTKTSPDLLEFLGFVVSEGSIYKRGDCLAFSNIDAGLRARFKELCRRLFGVEKFSEDAEKVVVNSTTLVKYLSLIGFNWGSKVVIPGYFYRLTKEEIMAFVKGYFEGDGTVSIVAIEGIRYPTPVLYSKDRGFLSEFQALMQIKLGISTNLRKHNTPMGLMHKLVVRGNEGRKEFAKVCKAGCASAKSSKLMEMTKVRRAKEHENIPRPGLLIAAVKSLPYKKFRNHDYYVYGSHPFTKHAMERLFDIARRNRVAGADVKKEVGLLRNDNIAWERIERIEDAGERELYDFTVDKDNFTAAPYLLMHNSKFYGESEANLRNIFDEAEKNAPSIIFIDEIDSIAPKREEVTGEVERRVVSQLLTLMDGLKKRGKVIVIAATNRPNAIDPALRRGGRFDREIEIPVPDRNGRLEILKIHTRNMPIDKSVSLEWLADITYGYVGADMSALTKETAMSALRRVLPEIKWKNEEELPREIMEKLVVNKGDFENALRMVEPSAMREVMVEVPKVRWTDIGGLDDVKQRLQEMVEWPLKNPESFARVGIKPPKGILLYGPPGTGKTMLGKAVATESGANFISIKGPQVYSKWVGESEKAIRDIFRRARQVAPTIIFFDEIDALAPRRGANTGTQVTETTVSQLLSEMSGLEDLKGVVVMAATNRPDMIDSALLRPGRFDRLLYVPTPDEKTRLEIFKIHTKDMPLKGVNLKELAEKTDGFSGADIEALAREAGMDALREDIDTKEIKPKHFEEALKSVGPSITPNLQKHYTSFEDRRRKMQEDRMKSDVPNYIG
jgi:SpoVK/Ycf46/Vps4 family AAA+-type ATPase